MEATGDSILRTLRMMEGELRANCVVDLNRDGTYMNVLKGCFVKCFEYAAFSRSLVPEMHPFFVAPALRGICEDFIALRYLQIKRTADRDNLLKNKMMSLIVEATEKQQVFFKKRRPFQPVFTKKLKHSVSKATLPNTRNMATEVELDDLYDFMYAITSDIVHFNPRVIIRNAWGKTKDRFEHSVSNFDVYYVDFCQTYSLYFLCAYARAFLSELSFSTSYLVGITSLERDLDEKLRWPEAITFEEMNIKGPSEILRVLMKMGAKSGNEFS